MRILLLSPHDHLVKFLESFGDEVFQTTEKVTTEFAKTFDFGVSYGYRHLIKKDVLELLTIINLHISFLPHNRGADPNFWSWVDDTLKGITIHFMDEGLDTGDIIFQREISFEENETLASSYKKLNDYIQFDFTFLWPGIRLKIFDSKPQVGKGSYHKSKDKEQYMHLLHKGWDTPVSDIQNYFKFKGAEAK